ncbi:MAG TPA: SIMPL domain-containing protein [Candidatus Eisenbacteria bacterium]|nr:SIMPL domain-containing protein [Candidatus Eisenbacteria bacterium]
MQSTGSLTSVSALGVALADYDTAIFSITVEGRGKNGPAAKTAARPAIDALNACLKALEKDGVAIARDELTADLSVGVEQEYDHSARRNKRIGYLATYALSFKSESVDRASEVFDKLSSIEGCEVQSPDFRVKDIQGLQKSAFADAWAKVQQRFSDECESLGLKRGDYALATYQTRYDESESAGPRPMRAMAAMASAESVGGGGPPPVDIKAGKSTVKVTLTATFASKEV